MHANFYLRKNSLVRYNFSSLAQKRGPPVTNLKATILSHDQILYEWDTPKLGAGEEISDFMITGTDKSVTQTAFIGHNVYLNEKANPENDYTLAVVVRYKSGLGSSPPVSVLMTTSQLRKLSFER